MIPRRLVRTVPENTTPQVEAWWDQTRALHPGWDCITLRDPIDPGLFPLTAPHWDACTTGAQFAGLIRLEAILTSGGIYLDSDVEVYRPLTPLLNTRAFAAWEDPGVVPDAIFGAEAGHPAVQAMLDLALERLHSEPGEWRTGPNAWGTGPGVFTTILPGRDDVLLLPPGSLYPYHYTQPHRATEDHSKSPWCFAAHHWAGSWIAREAG